ncbi:MAG TPA: hypothetical protein VEI02_08130 [Planctomycetota bacterium]|nr:hypothetical protein [Planctomycetota bacterium]
MRVFVLIAALLAAGRCDLALENPGGSKAGAPYSFTVTSASLPVKLVVTAGGEEVWNGEVQSSGETVTIQLAEASRGKTLEMAAENRDGCVVTWSETIQ